MEHIVWQMVISSMDKRNTDKGKWEFWSGSYSVNRNFTEKVAFQQRHEGSEGANHVLSYLRERAFQAGGTASAQASRWVSAGLSPGQEQASLSTME